MNLKYKIILHQQLDGCNVTFEATGPIIQRSGAITSIHHPEPYPAGLNCEYHFKNSADTMLRLTFASFDLREPVEGTGGQCAFDFVDIFVIESKDAPMKLLHRSCGRTPPTPLVSSALHIAVYFK